MKKVTVTAWASGSVSLQDTFPAEGTFTRDVPAGATKSFFLTDGQYNHIRSQLDGMLTAGLLTTVLVNESEEGRSDKFAELKKMLPPASVRSGYGDFFVGLDGKPYFKSDAGVVYNLGMTGSDPIVFIGTIAVAGDFPLVGVAKPGWLYIVTAPVTDPLTGNSFLKDDEIVWTTAGWDLVGYTRKNKTLVIGDSPYPVTDADDLLFVDSATGAITVNLPAAASRNNKRFEIMDVGNNALVNNITVLVAGAPFMVMNVNSQYTAWESDGSTWRPVASQNELLLASTHRLGNGADHANVGLADSHRTGNGEDHSTVLANKNAIAAIVDDHIRSVHANLPAQTDESEVSAVLTGVVGKQFTPKEIVIQVTSATGVVAGDGTINIGTSSDGAEIAPAVALTGLAVAGDTRRFPLTAATYNILGNATLYANVEAADSTATTLVLKVFVLGEQF